MRNAEAAYELQLARDEAKGEVEKMRLKFMQESRERERIERELEAASQH